MAKKQKNNYTLWIILGVVVLIFLSTIGMYNSLVSLDTEVDNTWANVETQYQRRMDLIPNLVNTVKGYASHEEEVLIAVTNARSAWTGATTTDAQIAAANQMESALGRLMVVVENYPDLKANQNFLALQDELAGTENRIAVERTRFNEAIRNYNRKTRTFPSNIIAGMFGFDEKQSFEAQEGADVAPQVEF